MLTDMFYYDYYRPYIVRDTSAATATRRPKGRAAAHSAGKPVMLNKSLNTAAVGYAQGVTRNVLDFKEAARDAMYAADRYDRRAAAHGEQSAREDFSEDAEALASAYNRASAFMAAQGHSAALRDFYGQMADTAAANREKLAGVGLKLGDDGDKMTYDAAKTEAADDGAFRKNLAEARPAFRAMYDDTVRLMRAPLTDHMEFKSFRYYYNYRQGVTKEDTFDMIRSGTMIDIAL